MMQSNLATASLFQPDNIVIGGRTLGFDEILNEDFFVPSKIAELSATFRNNKPFTHLVVENLFSPVLLELINEDFDLLKKDELRVYNTMNEKKLGTRPYASLGHASELYFSTIHSLTFVNFLEQITGIEGLITGPRHSGGLHEIPTGGKFAMHVDFNQHEVTKLENRRSLSPISTRIGCPPTAGHLNCGARRRESAKLKFSRFSADRSFFAHSSKSLHGHPTPVDAPNGRSRRSAAAYYYSNGRSDGESTDFHTTIIFKRRNAARRERIVTITPQSLWMGSRSSRRGGGNRGEAASLEKHSRRIGCIRCPQARDS